LLRCFYLSFSYCNSTRKGINSPVNNAIKMREKCTFFSAKCGFLGGSNSATNRGVTGRSAYPAQRLSYLTRRF
jgi:hypothetical protein